MIQTIRVQTTNGPDVLGEELLHDIQHFLPTTKVTAVKTTKVYRLEGVSKQHAKKLADALFCEQINQTYTLNEPLLDRTKHIFEIAYKPGVMNPEVGSILKSAHDLGIPLTAADTSHEYALYGKLTDNDMSRIIQTLHLVNPTVEQTVSEPPQTLQISGKIGKTAHIPIRTMTNEELMALSKDALFLNLEEMQVIQQYFQKLHRDPTDCELEVLAQTWSEHCVHKTFKAALTIDGKKKAPFITRIKQTAKKSDKRIISAFVDNSGVIDFFDDYAICGKVETHNSPSAIEPYGGAMTGSGGVFRDVLGTGQGAKVIASTDIFCFAPPDLAQKDIPPGCLPPVYLLKSVVAGVRDYGNRVGIPTNNGSVHFHKDFRAKPTVAVGSYGLIPKAKAQKQTPKVADLILTIGGRTGRDGIHGATFSSGEMTERTLSVSGTAVQIGNAIEEKRVIDAIQVLRDRDLIRAINDCGAGGFSSAIGEMGEETGVTVHLEQAPLKYTGLKPWEIFLSESQERMILAIDPKNRAKVLKILKLFNVEAAVIGTFDGSKRFQVLYGKEKVCDLSMDFLHNGLPQRHMVGKTTPHKAPSAHVKLPNLPKNISTVWKAVLAQGNVCSKEPVVRLYDHNVQGTAALHPFGGQKMDAPNDGAIIKPFLHKPYGMAITHGLNPALNSLDPYWGSVWAITEAVANFIALGGDLKDAALIDNFIWPFPDEASLADLDKAVDACTDMAKLLKMPFVSGKDSLSSTYRYPDGRILKIPPVLLISVFGKIKDVRKTASTDFKQPGSTIVLVGKPDMQNLGGSAYFASSHHTGQAPRVDVASLPAVFQTITKSIQKNALLACHDISEGGLATALAEMCFGGDCGAVVDLEKIAKTRPDFVLFNETAGTFLVEVADEATAKKLFARVPHTIIGRTRKEPTLTVKQGKTVLADVNVATLKKSWQQPMREIFG